MSHTTLLQHMNQAIQDLLIYYHHMIQDSLPIVYFDDYIATVLYYLELILKDGLNGENYFFFFKFFFRCLFFWKDVLLGFIEEFAFLFTEY